MDTNDMQVKRMEALAKHLECDVNDIVADKYDDETYEAQGGEYLVLTYDESMKRAEDYIRDSLWAFKASFILPYIEAYEDMTLAETKDFEITVETIQQQMCEDCNPVIYNLVKRNIQRLINDACNEDGIGHFLSPYDGLEYEEGEFYIYRTN